MEVNVPRCLPSCRAVSVAVRFHWLVSHCKYKGLWHIALFVHSFSCRYFFSSAKRQYMMVWSYNLQNDPPSPTTCTQCATLVLDQSQSDKWTLGPEPVSARFCKEPLPFIRINLQSRKHLNLFRRARSHAPHPRQIALVVSPPPPLCSCSLHLLAAV